MSRIALPAFSLPALVPARVAAVLRSISPSPAVRLAFGLVALMLSILLLADFFVGGFLPDTMATARRQRTLGAELIGAYVTQALRQADEQQLRSVLDTSVRRDPGLLSARLIVHDIERASAGEHARHWRLAADAPSTIDNLRLPLISSGRRIGELQLAFEPAEPSWPWGWLRQPVVLGSLLMTGLGLLAFYLYVRRTMRYLDPSAAVPERVRTAFDTLTEAVLVLDTGARIMLANRALRALAPQTQAELIGLPVASLDWLATALSARGIEPPWAATLADSQPRLDLRLRVMGSELGPREVMMNTSPITDGFGRVRGCLLTFDDVTQLHQRTLQLRATIADLQATREEIARKNEELTLLATRDPLTGALNRRAFTAESERAIEAAAAESRPVCCIMCDVDHFKSINDRFGHGGGDDVLKAVTKALSRGLRTGDLLGRYGGEEFCILLPDASLEQAQQIGERLRAEVQAHAGMAVRQFADVVVTMSFGVEQLGGSAPNFERVVDHADQALYYSKKNGRNRVTAFAQLAAAAPAEA